MILRIVIAITSSLPLARPPAIGTLASLTVFGYIKDQPENITAGQIDNDDCPYVQ